MQKRNFRSIVLFLVGTISIALAVRVLHIGASAEAPSVDENEGQETTGTPADDRSSQIAVDACNSDKVKDILLNGTVNKVKESLLKQFSDENGPNTPKIIASAKAFSASVQSVRQVDYDQSNNVRYCAADFAYKNMLPVDLLFFSLMSDPDAICTKGVTYKIEPLLDQPGQVYVSWRCQRGQR